MPHFFPLSFIQILSVHIGLDPQRGLCSSQKKKPLEARRSRAHRLAATAGSGKRADSLAHAENTRLRLISPRLQAHAGSPSRPGTELRTDGTCTDTKCKLVNRRLADGAAASLGLSDGRGRGCDEENPITVVSGRASSTWWPARPSGIARGEQRLSIRELVVEPRTTPRSSSHSEHNAHVSDLPRRLLSCACAARSVSCSPNAHRCTTAVGRPKARAWCSLGLWQCSWGLRVCTWRAAHLPHCTSCLICSWKRAMSRAR